MTASSALPRTQQAFTLVEVLLVLVLSTLLLGLSFASLRSYLKTTDRVEQALEKATRERAALTFVRQQLREVLAVAVTRDGVRGVLFSGDESGLDFVGRIPSHRAAGGIFYNTLRMRRHADGAALDFSYRRIPAGHAWAIADLAAGDSDGTRALLDNLQDMSFAYFGRVSRDAPAEWHTQWSSQLWLPDLVRLEIVRADGASSALSVALRADFVARRVALRLTTDQRTAPATGFNRPGTDEPPSEAPAP